MAKQKPEKQSCAECGCKDTTETMEDHTFPYGAGVEQVELTSVIPIHTCNNPDCGFQWYNWVADEIMDATVQQYLQEQTKK